MELIKAIILGLIQGLAEFLPISSSGHLAIFKHVLDFDTDTGLLFDVLLHLGTLAAVFVAFRKDIFKLIKEGLSIIGQFFQSIYLCLCKKEKWQPVITTPYRRFVMMVIISTIPTGILGILFSDWIDAASATLIVPGILLLINGIQLLISDRLADGKLNEETASYGKAAIVGVAQGVATFPGISRSGTTITACVACGFSREFAVKYSFIMSIPAILGALVLELLDFSPEMLSASDWMNYLVGTVIAGLVGYVCIKTMLVVVRGKKFKYFAYYCFAMGAFAVIFSLLA
ncbi:MAG: undecaprenyl-diphosphate phosphatase [Lachnospiraceae bacterium]|nr:undecaprenyl-diphosphate phosphatase [Lachnospiraceae bacterium]